MLIAPIAVTVYREVPQQLGREFRAYGANLPIIPANEAATFDQEKISAVREILSGQEIIGAAPFLYERLEINKQYILTGGKEEEFAFMNLDDLQQIVGKPNQISIAQFSVVVEVDSLKTLEQKISAGFSAAVWDIYSRKVSACKFSVSIAILSIVLSIIVTGVAGLIPVRIATAVDPAIVLRGE